MKTSIWLISIVAFLTLPGLGKAQGQVSTNQLIIAVPIDWHTTMSSDTFELYYEEVCLVRQDSELDYGLVCWWVIDPEGVYWRMYFPGYLGLRPGECITLSYKCRQ